MNLDNLCMGCMKEKSSQDGKCPYCGFDNTKENNEPHQLPIWHILNGEFLVGKALGEGGFGVTYVGFDLNLERKVAIKEFLSDDRERFTEEARILAEIDEQPGVVKVYRYLISDSKSYMVMEYLEGKSLLDYVKGKGGKISAEETIAIFKPIISSLAMIHDKGVIHRDISPDNIMITDSGKVKLIDFGAARDKSAKVSDLRVYKKYYSPIEQRSSETELGTYSDIYSLCASMYRCIMGEPPVDPVDREKNDTLKLPNDYGANLNPIQEAAILNGLALHSEERIKNASDLYYFLYMFSKEANATPDKMQQKIKSSSTQVIMDKIADEKKKERNTKLIVIAAVTLFIGVLIFMIGGAIIGRINNSNSVVVSESNSNSNSNSDSGHNNASLSAEDMNYFRDLIYEGIGFAPNGDLEAVATDICTYVTNLNVDTNDKFNALVTEYADTARNNAGYSDTGWLVLPYESDVTDQQIMTDIIDMMSKQNASVDMGLIGIAIGQRTDGMLMVTAVYF